MPSRRSPGRSHRWVTQYAAAIVPASSGMANTAAFMASGRASTPTATVANPTGGTVDSIHFAEPRNFIRAQRPGAPYDLCANPLPRNSPRFHAMTLYAYGCHAG